MTNNNTVDTAQKGQTTTKNNIPTGKVKTLTNATERRKAREEQFRNFRINALKRRCKRIGFDEAKTNEYVEKLKKQMDAPKEYSILITFNQVYPRKKMKEGEVFKPDIEVFLEDIKGKNISYLYKGDSFVRIDGDQNILAKIREIAPTSAKIYPYAKKMESVLADVKPPEKAKKPTNNTAEKKAAAKKKRKMSNILANKKRRHGRGQFARKEVRNLRQELKKNRKARIVQLAAKKASEGSKTAKKAA